MPQFWVVGGEYTDTRFRDAIGGAEDWIGPFPNYEAARKRWAELAWSTVDDCNVRYRIEKASARPRGSMQRAQER